MRRSVFLLVGLLVTGCAFSPGGKGAGAPGGAQAPVGGAVAAPSAGAGAEQAPAAGGEQSGTGAEQLGAEQTGSGSGQGGAATGQSGNGAAQPSAPQPAVEPALTIAPAQVLQGDIARVTVRNLPPGTPVSIRVDGFPEPVKPFALHGAIHGFVAVPAWGNPRSYPVHVTWEGGSLEGTIEIVRKEFTEDWLWVTEEQEQLRSDPRAEEDTRKVVRARSQTSPVPLWDGPFQLPLEGPVTTEFGEIRFVNGKEAGRHSGTDFGVPEGTPIRAPARGIVRLADDLVVTGGTIYLDHGLNLFTGYLHLSKILVAEGQEVEAGEIIGEVGTTGFSTGPHLHWMAVVGNVAVNPYLLLTDTYTMFDRP